MYLEYVLATTTSQGGEALRPGSLFLSRYRTLGEAFYREDSALASEARRLGLRPLDHRDGRVLRGRTSPWR